MLLQDLNSIQLYTFEQDLHEGTDNLTLMEIELRKVFLLKAHPEGRLIIPHSNNMRAITIGKSSIYLVYQMNKRHNCIYLLKIRDYNQCR